MSDEDSRKHKTIRIAMVALLLALIAGFTFAYKIDACAIKPETHESCKEEFVEMKSGGNTTDHKCTEGAIIEVISSPPAAKAGILCHCTKTSPNTLDASH